MSPTILLRARPKHATVTAETTYVRTIGVRSDSAVVCALTLVFRTACTAPPVDLFVLRERYDTSCHAKSRSRIGGRKGRALRGPLDLLKRRLTG